jgi:hypothetical protein
LSLPYPPPPGNAQQDRVALGPPTAIGGVGLRSVPSGAVTVIGRNMPSLLGRLGKSAHFTA